MSETLSVCLRRETASLHRAVEQTNGLPASIVTIADYIACLTRFHSIFEALETQVAGFADWPQLGIDVAARRRAPALRADLLALGQKLSEPLVVAADVGFCGAIGILYVLEGSTLGGLVLLRDFRRRMGGRIDGATAFFSGHGPATGAMWQSFRAALDKFGDDHPEAWPAVIAGAVHGFQCFAGRPRE